MGFGVYLRDATGLSREKFSKFSGMVLTEILEGYNGISVSVIEKIYNFAIVEQLT
jgi:hypothetical protein